MKNFLFSLRKFFCAKWIIQKPSKKKILIFDGESSNIFYLFLKKEDTSILYIRYEQINLYLVFFTIFKSGFSKLKENYIKNYLELVSPKIIITLIDNNILFYKLKNLYMNGTFISCQLSYRDNQFFDNCKNYLSKKEHNLKVDHMFVLGKNDGERYQKVIQIPNGNIHCHGSIKNNHFLIKNKVDKIKLNLESILFISRSGNWKLDRKHLIHKEKNIINNLILYCKKNNLKLNILTRSLKSDESFYRKNLNHGDWNYIFAENENIGFSYDKINSSKLIVYVNSTLGLEALSKKIRCVSFPPDYFPMRGYTKQFSESGPFWSCKFNYEIMEKLINQVINYTNEEWEKILQNHIQDVIEYDPNNQKLRNLIKSI